MRSTIIAAYKQVLLDCGCRRADDRQAFSKQIKATKEGKIALPTAWTPPFAVIDDQTQETLSYSGQLAKRARVLIESETYMRSWRREQSVQWQFNVLLCAAAAELDALSASVEATAPRLVHSASVQTLDGDVSFVANVRLASNTEFSLEENFLPNYGFRDLKFIAQYGRYKITDRLLAPLEGPEEKE